MLMFDRFQTLEALSFFDMLVSVLISAFAHSSHEVVIITVMSVYAKGVDLSCHNVGHWGPRSQGQPASVKLKDVFPSFSAG